MNVGGNWRAVAIQDTQRNNARGDRSAVLVSTGRVAVSILRLEGEAVKVSARATRARRVRIHVQNVLGVVEHICWQNGCTYGRQVGANEERSVVRQALNVELILGC